jgi:hypothetical protein
MHLYQLYLTKEWGEDFEHDEPDEVRMQSVAQPARGAP